MNQSIYSDFGLCSQVAAEGQFEISQVLLLPNVLREGDFVGPDGLY